MCQKIQINLPNYNIGYNSTILEYKNTALSVIDICMEFMYVCLYVFTCFQQFKHIIVAYDMNAAVTRFRGHWEDCLHNVMLFKFKRNMNMREIVQ